MSAPVREATKDYSKRRSAPSGLARVPGGALRAGLCATALAGAILLLVAEFSAVVEVVVGALETVRRSVDGRDNHDYALLVVGLASLPLAYGALRGARAAGAGLAVLGAVALFVALAIDLPDTDASGRLPESVAFEDARARAGTGLYLELVGGGLLLTSGGLLWALGGTPRGP